MAGDKTRMDGFAAGATGANGFINVIVRRSDPAAPAVFDVPAAEPMVLLDVLQALQWHRDASLAFRFSCRAGRCGTCTIRLNGRAVLACQTPVAGGARLVVEPLGGLPVVKDLVVDMGTFQTNWSEVLRLTEPGPAGAMTSGGTDQALLDSSRDCISCGACYAACPVASSGKDFLGPAALARAAGDYPPEVARAAAVMGPRGFAGCHSVGACSVVCPRELDPALLIRSLRRGRRRRVT